MLRIGLTAVVTAALCFTITVATGLAGGADRVINLKIGDIAAYTPDNFHCQVVAKNQVGCGAKITPGSVQVYYAPHQLEVIKFGATLKKGTILLNVKR